MYLTMQQMTNLNGTAKNGLMHLKEYTKQDIGDYTYND